MQSEQQGDRIQVALEELEELIEKRLTKLQYSPSEVQVIKQVIMYSQLVDGTQGVVKLLMEGIGSITQPNPSQYAPRVVYDGGIALRVDGGSSLGMVVLDFAVHKAIERAKESGLAMVGVFHSCNSTGALGYYVEKIASHGLVGIVSSGSTPTVAAFGSAERNFGTNPLAYAIPGPHEQPLVVYDASTSAMSFWGVKQYAIDKKPLPEDVALDKDGRPTTDASLVGVCFENFWRSKRLRNIFVIGISSWSVGRRNSTRYYQLGKFCVGVFTEYFSVGTRTGRKQHYSDDATYWCKSSL